MSTGAIAVEQQFALGLDLTNECNLACSFDRVSLLRGAIECVRANAVPAGLIANRDFAECVVDAETAIAPELMTLFFDPQTAGGLLISIDQRDGARLEQITREAGTPAQIGRVVERADGKPIRLI